jgi:hypothetical protein
LIIKAAGVIFHAPLKILPLIATYRGRLDADNDLWLAAGPWKKQVTASMCLASSTMAKKVSVRIRPYCACDSVSHMRFDPVNI